jgi:hypothetical protein
MDDLACTLKAAMRLETETATIDCIQLRLTEEGRVTLLALLVTLLVRL